MPNWCITNYTATGPEVNVRRLHETMTQLQTMAEPLVPNGFGPAWLGCLVSRAGGDRNAVWCRGEWYPETYLSPDGRELDFTVSSAWAEPREWRAFVERAFGVRLLYDSEEPGSIYYVTNREGFPRFLVDVEEVDKQQFYTLGEALDHAFGALGLERPADDGEALALLRRYGDEQGLSWCDVREYMIEG